MEFIRCKIYSGEILELPWDGDSTYYCPICGMNHGNEPAYSNEGFPSFEICPSCNFEFGYDESQAKYGAVRPLSDRITVERLKWLDRMGWREEAINQVCDVFNLTIESLKKDHDRFSLSGKGPEQTATPLQTLQDQRTPLSVSQAIRSTIRSGSSTRRFDDSNQLSDGVLAHLLTNAALSETAFNLKHCRFVVIKDNDLRVEIRKHVPDCELGHERSIVTDAPLLILLTADIKSWEKSPLREFEELLDGLLAKYTNPIVERIDHLYAHNCQLQRDEAQRSIGAATQTLLLSASSLGLQSFCIIDFEHDTVADLVNLPEHFCIGPMIALGQPHLFSSADCVTCNPDEYMIVDRFPE